MAKTIQQFNRTGSTQNRPRHGRPKKLSAYAQHHIQRLCLGNRHMSVWLQPGEEYKDKCVVPTVNHGGGSVMVWECMSAAGTGELHTVH